MSTDMNTPTDSTDTELLPGGVLADLAGEGRVGVDMYNLGTVPVPGESYLGKYDGRLIRVDRPNYDFAVDGDVYSEFYRVPTQRGVFDVEKVVDETGESRTYKVAVERVDGDDDVDAGEPTDPMILTKYLQSNPRL